MGSGGSHAIIVSGKGGGGGGGGRGGGGALGVGEETRLRVV